MRLRSLYIEDYKNIKKQTFDFSNSTGYIALIGLNGSGKSNLLEAIGLIFNGILNKKKIPFDYTIVYEHDGKLYSRKKNSAAIDGKRVKNSDMLYPTSVIACYSGEDLRLWHMAFEDYYMHYFKKAIDNLLSSPELIYINRYCWNIALITLMSSKDTKVKAFLETYLGIVDLEKVEVSFEFAETDNFKDHQALKWIKRIKDECLDENGKATVKSLLSYDVPLLANQTKESTIFHYLYLLSQPQKNPEKGNNVEKYITKISVENKGISSFNFSEGHKKLILIECITNVLGNKESLLLFDEPDAHVHIAFKKEILKCINDFEGQTIMTTHSPMFLNKRWDGFDENNIFYMHDGKIENTESLKHLAELTDNEIDYFEGSFILSSKKILVTEGTYDGLYLIQAVSFFENDDAKYSKLRNIAIVYSGGTGNALSFYEQILKDTSDYHDKIVYLFDYDKAGLTGWKSINGINDPKVTPIFYQEDYSITLNTNVSDNNIAPKDTIMVEDLFDSHSYESKVKVIHDMNTHRDFRCNTQGRTTEAIKSYIEKNYKSFKAEWFLGFKPTLDKLLEVFDLN